MKKATIAVSFLTALFISTADLFKFIHLPGTRTLMYLTGLLMAVYFAFFILDKMGEMAGGRTLPSHVAGALSALLTGFGITFRLNYWPGAEILLILGLSCFGLIFVPLLFIQKSGEPGSDKIRNGAGALGFMAFGFGTLFKLEHWAGAQILLSLFPVCLFLLYFPRYMMDKTIAPEIKHQYLRTSFLTIIVGSIMALYFVKSIEIHDMANIPENPWYNKINTQ